MKQVTTYATQNSFIIKLRPLLSHTVQQVVWHGIQAAEKFGNETNANYYAERGETLK